MGRPRVVLSLCFLLAACAEGAGIPNGRTGQSEDGGLTESPGAAGPGEPPEPCGADADCKGDRICEDGACVSPEAPTHVAMSGGAGGSVGSSGAGASDAATVADSGRIDAGAVGGTGGVAGTGMTPPTADELCPAACANQAAVGCPGFDVPGCEATCRDSFTTCAVCNNELGALHSCSAGVPVSAYFCEAAQPMLQPTSCLAEVSALVSCRLPACPGT